MGHSISRPPPRPRRLSTSRELLSWLTFPVHCPGSTLFASCRHLQTPRSAILLRRRSDIRWMFPLFLKILHVDSVLFTKWSANEIMKPETWSYTDGYNFYGLSSMTTYTLTRKLYMWGDGHFEKGRYCKKENFKDDIQIPISVHVFTIVSQITCPLLRFKLVGVNSFIPASKWLI